MNSTVVVPDGAERSFLSPGRRVSPDVKQTERRRAFVTGVSGGISPAIVRSLAEAGFDVALHCRTSNDEVAGLAESLSHGKKCRSFVVTGDLADPDRLCGMVDEAAERLGGLDALVNSAAWDPGAHPLDTIDRAFVDQMLAVNVAAPLMMSQAAAKWMCENGGGSIVNISSVHSRASLAGHSVYAATKGALEAMTRQLSVELGPARVRVNAVVPGFIAVSRTMANKTPEKLRKISDRTPLRRIGQPDDVAGVVTFLCSDAAAFVTGECMTIDGGASYRMPTHDPADTQDLSC